MKCELRKENSSWDPVQVQQGRREKLGYMIKTLQMFEFGSLHEAMPRGVKAPTTTELVDRTKDGDD